VKLVEKTQLAGGGRAALRIRRGAAGCCLARVASAPWRGRHPGAGPPGSARAPVPGMEG